MILLALFLILELITVCFLLGWDSRHDTLGSYLLEGVQLHFDLPSLVFVLLGVGAHVLILGRKPFVRGLRALVRLPKRPDSEIAVYYRKLSSFTLLLGVVGMAFFTIETFFHIRNPNEIGSYLAMSLFMFFYAGWLSVMVFRPISIRFAGDVSSEGRSLPIGSTLLGLTAYFLTRALLAILLVTLLLNWKAGPEVIVENEAQFIVEQATLTLNPADLEGNNFLYLSPRMYWDLPSILLFLLSLGAFRFAAGPVKNRFNLAPVCIVLGILCSFEGLFLMLLDFDPETFGSGAMVAMLTALYGMLAALVIVMNKPFFCTGLSVIWCLVIAIGTLANLDPYITGATLIPNCLYAIFLGLLVDFFAWLFREPKPKAVPEAPLTTDERQARAILDGAVEKERRNR